MKSIERALDILEIFTTKKDGFHLTEISKILDLANSTTHRFLAILKKRHYIEQVNGRDIYRLSPKILQLGAAVLNQMDIRVKALPIMEALAEKTGESTRLAVRSEGEVIYIQTVESVHALQVRGFTGKGVFIHSSAVGKVLLAYQPEEKIDQIMENKELTKFTEKTITDKTALKIQLVAVRHNGFAIDDEEGTVGSRCVAAPIFDHLGKITAALSIVGPSVRMVYEQFDSLAKLVKEAAASISRTLGWNEE